MSNSNPAASERTGHTNRLAREKSPYLLQHQHNPVDWHPWGQEAFTKARQENKPVFLSIGYSTCHWCHVMERESFENETIAALLNQHFVCIKVDREERPDVDKIYMTFVQAMTGGGGWPLNVFLTPDLKPFYGGTYWPPTSRYGQPGFPQVLDNVHQAWLNRREQITASAAELHEKLQTILRRDATSVILLSTNELHQAAAQFKSSYDPAHGGFGTAPKFPNPSTLAFLLQYAARFHDDTAQGMVLHTCQRMAAGGIYDHIGGGFSRYSVDAQWLVPHFEKMLYDNAQLAQVYLDASQITGQPSYAETARDILRYVLRDMTHPDGGFFSAEDADSEGHEGKFYTWSKTELARLLSPEEFRTAVRYYGLTDEGNFHDHSHPNPIPGQNVLSIVDPHLTEPESAWLQSARAKMAAARSARVRPHRDDKILASWNGLMLGALARASAVLRDESFLAAAEKNLAFLRRELWDAGATTLYHRWRDGARDTVQLQEAYAYLLQGTLDLYETTLSADHLEFAVALAGAMLAKFYDPDQGGFWQTTADAPDLIVRVKEDYDGAEPSGNSVAILSLLRLGAITDRRDFRDAAEKSLRLFSERCRQMPQAVPFLLLGLDFSLEEPRRLVIAGDAHSPAGRELLQAAHSVFRRNRVILGTAGPVEPFAKTLPVRDQRPTAYLCTGNACAPPTHDPGMVKQLLGGNPLRLSATPKG